MIDNRRLWKGDGCLTYKRCSTDRQDASLPDQEVALSSERTARGLNRVLASFEDDGLKGHDEKRPGLLAILRFVATHPNRVRNNEDFIPILVYDLSRFGRFDDPKKIFAYFVEIERYGYEFYSITERIRSRGNTSDWVQLIIKGEQAYDYSVNLSKYGMRTGCELAQKGWWPGGSAPYGYDRMTFGPDGKPKYRYTTRPDKTVEKRTVDGTLVESIPPTVDHGRVRSAWSDKLRTDKVKLAPGHPDLVAIVKLIFDKFVNDRWGLRRIAAHLNAHGVRPPRGPNWLHTTVRSILINPAYSGALVYGRRSDGKHHWLTINKQEDHYSTVIERKDVPGRTFVYRTAVECIEIKGCHEALVAPALWEKAQHRFDAHRIAGKSRSGLGVRSNYLLSGDGLIRCEHCAYRFQGDTDRKSKIRYYIDGGYHAGGKSVCFNSMVPADGLEDRIIREIGDRIVDGRAALFASRKELEEAIEQALLAGRQVPSTNDSAVKQVEAAVAEHKGQVQLLLKSVSEQNAHLLDGRLAELGKEIASLEQELRALRVAERATGIVTGDLKALARQAADNLMRASRRFSTRELPTRRSGSSGISCRRSSSTGRSAGCALVSLKTTHRATRS